MPRTFGLTVALCAALATPVRAQDDAGASPDEEERFVLPGGPFFTVQIGVKGGLALSLLSEPDESTINLPVPSFAGFGGGAGLALEALWRDGLGLEVDVLYMAASGRGEITFPRGFDVDEELSSSEIQVATLLKLQLAYPLGGLQNEETELSVKPYLGLGATFVFQNDADFTVSQSVINLDTAIEPESYTMLTVSLGAAIDAGPMRIPIELRGSWQPLDDDPRERVDFEPQTGGVLTRLAVRSTWEAQFFFLIGVQYRLELH